MLEGCGTLPEVRHSWTIDDVADCHELLDMKNDAEAEAMARARGGRQ